MSIEADLAEGNIRLKRWMDHAKTIRKPDGSPFIVEPGEPHMYASKLWPVASRFRVIERRKFANMVSGGPDAPDTIAKVIDAECCMAAAPNFGEALQKYAIRVADPKRDDYFVDRNLRGESTLLPPIDPPEWEQHRREAIRAAQQAGEVTQEWVKRSARGQMERLGLLDPVKFELAWARAEAMGLVAK